MSETISEYQQEQIEALSMVRTHFFQLGPSRREALAATTSDYVDFRHDLKAFLDRHFSDICIQKCFQSRLSACCSREGIIAFFADVVVNALVSPDADLDVLYSTLQRPNRGKKCIFLGPRGCLWQMKPIVCERFLCDSASNVVFTKFPHARQVWDELLEREKRFTWPDRPVLFDALERHFMNAGYHSPLMYLHNSPGLLRVKSLSGLIQGKNG